MTVESGNYVGDLVITNPPGTDLQQQGDDHLRLIKKVLKQTFPVAGGVFTAQALTWTTQQTIITAGPPLVLVNNVNDANPDNLIISKDRGAANQVSDYVGQVTFRGKDSAPATVDYGFIRVGVVDPTSGSVDGKFEFVTPVNGAYAARLLIGAGIYTTSQSDPGANGIAAGSFVEAGVALASKYLSNVNLQVFTANGTYTPTSGMKKALLVCVGGGGGGGGCANSSAGQLGSAGGGGGGAMSFALVTAAAVGASKAVTVPTGVSGGAAGNNAGTTGGDVSIGVLCVAKGGVGAAGAAANTVSTGGAGGAGGSGTGDVKISGEQGGNGAQAPNAATVTMIGKGGSAGWGFGMGGQPQNGSGGNGGNYGGGGAGGYSANGAGAQAGGSGAPGIAFVLEFA